ncbi:unnamed protein product [Phytophthora fragariaefolia]|uniref:Unnamed protein product n=1 Tax=Phytophthora fragariaefolia TaxID=1490495 RepID=A0A9W6Y3H9_9STRA|nr:unnamed protein product [Phytophthora fragariaefolia]
MLSGSSQPKLTIKFVTDKATLSVHGVRTMHQQEVGPKRLAPRVPQVAADAAAARGPRRKKLKWRTRDQQSSQLYNLELDLHDLRQEINALQEYGSVLRTHTLNQRESLDDYYVKRVMQYHKVFECGYNANSDGFDGESLTSADAIEFIKHMMDEEVAVGSFVGYEVILDQWARYSAAFPGLHCSTTQSRVASADEVTIVSTTTEYTFEISQTTIQTLFPRIRSEQPQIGAKLLGRKFRGTGVSTFSFDPRSHRVVCYDAQVDFFKVLASMLQDSDELCVLFEGAKISEEFFIGDTSCYPVLQLGDNEEKPRYWVSIASDDGEDDDSGQQFPDLHKLQLDHILGASSRD